MSARYLNSTTPNKDANIKVNDADVRGGLTAATVTATTITSTANVISGGLLTGKVTFQPLPIQYTQATSASTTVTVGEFDQSFDITTFTLTTAKGELEAFIVNHAGVSTNSMFIVTLVSQTGAYNAVGGAPLVYVIQVGTGSFKIGIKNIGGTGASAFTGPLKFRVKLLSNVAA